MFGRFLLPAVLSVAAFPASAQFVQQGGKLTASLLLVDDAGDAGGPFASGATTIQNSQCSMNVAGSSFTKNGNTLTLSLNITFKPAFAGNRVIWVAGRDVGGANNTGWQSMGTTTVQ
jgi:hypothetical protein